jgi:hypothetical protein
MHLNLMPACRALLGGMGQVLLIVRPGVYGERLPSGQSDASTSTARGRHIDLFALKVGLCRKNLKSGITG